MKMDWEKNIILFLTSQTISLFGSSLVQYAIMWYITLQTKSGMMMTAYIICGFLPTLVLSPFAGVWADRYNRKILIMFSDSMIAFATLILAVLLLMGYDSLWLLFVISAVRALGSAVQTPAINAFIPQMVPEEKYMRINAINGSIQSFVMLISPMLSGALLMMATIEVILFIDIFTAMIGVLTLLFFLHVPAHEKALEKEKVSYFKDMKDGILYIKEHPYIQAFFIFCAVFFVLAAPSAFLTPLQVVRSFGDDVWRLTLLEMTFSVGMMIGGILIAAWGGFKNKVHSMVFACFLIGICTAALGLVPWFWLYLSFMVLVGIFIPVFNTPATVLLQVKVEPAYMGRVFGILAMISSSVMPLGMLFFGPLADIIKIEYMLIATGTLMSVQGFFLLGSKSLIEAGKP